MAHININCKGFEYMILNNIKLTNEEELIYWLKQLDKYKCGKDCTWVSRCSNSEYANICYPDDKFMSRLTAHGIVLKDNIIFECNNVSIFKIIHILNNTENSDLIIIDNIQIIGNIIVLTLE